MRLGFLALVFALGGCTSIRPDPIEVVESYQLYVAPTFNKPIDLIVERTADSAFISEQRYRGLAGYAPKRLGSPSTRKLSKPEWQAFAQAIKMHGFWTGRVKSYYETVFDGTHTLIIARNGTTAKVVDCYDPIYADDRNIMGLIRAFGELKK